MIVYQFEDAQFDPNKNAFIIKDNVTKLSASECLILRYLIEHSGEVIKRELLLEVGWPDKVVVPNSLNVAIANIRKAFRQKSDLIMTIKGCGFTIPSNTFEKIDISVELPLISTTLELEETSQITETEQPSNAAYLSDKKSSNTAYPLYKRLIWIVGGVASILWIILWVSDWQKPICVNVVGQKVCGNIEKLNLEKVPLMGNHTLFIDAQGQFYEKN